MRIVPHARPRGDDAGAGRRLLDGRGQQANRSRSASGGASEPTIRIGSDGFYEAKLMAEIDAQALEAAGYKVDRTASAWAPGRCPLPALESGQIDLKPEYIGCGLAWLRPGKPTGDPAANLDALQQSSPERAAGSRSSTTHPHSRPERVRRPQGDGGPANLDEDERPRRGSGQAEVRRGHRLPDEPGLRRGPQERLRPRRLEQRDEARCVHTPMAQALDGKTIDVAELCSTQPDIIVNGFALLQDDKQTQPADNIAPLVRDDLLAKLSDKAGFSRHPQRRVRGRWTRPRWPTCASR